MSPKTPRRKAPPEAASQEADHLEAGAAGQAEAGDIKYEAPRGKPAAPQEVEGIDAELVRLHTQRHPPIIITQDTSENQKEQTMDVQERWDEIQSAIEMENTKPPVEDGHDPVAGDSGAETASEVDMVTAAEMGTASEAAPADEVMIETDDGGAIQEVSGYVEAAPPTIPDAMEIIHGADDRVYVGNTTAYPFRTICHLEITAANGKRYIGSGAFIGPRVVLTAGHCVYLHGDGGWARSVRVIPGRRGNVMPYGDATGTRYWSVKGWVNNRDSDYDYAVIVLPTALGNKVGWMGLANLSFFSLLGLNVNNSGYPGDKPYGTQWWNSNNILAVTGRRLYYRIDTMGGQSGSPVWRYKDGQRHIVGIHTTGASVFNGATRVNGAVFKNLVNWKNL